MTREKENKVLLFAGNALEILGKVGAVASVSFLAVAAFQESAFNILDTGLNVMHGGAGCLFSGFSFFVGNVTKKMIF